MRKIVFLALLFVLGTFYSYGQAKNSNGINYAPCVTPFRVQNNIQQKVSRFMDYAYHHNVQYSGPALFPALPWNIEQ
jgi:hypothetical protein